MDDHLLGRHHDDSILARALNAARIFRVIKRAFGDESVQFPHQFWRDHLTAMLPQVDWT